VLAQIAITLRRGGHGRDRKSAFTVPYRQLCDIPGYIAREMGCRLRSGRHEHTLVYSTCDLNGRFTRRGPCLDQPVTEWIFQACTHNCSLQSLRSYAQLSFALCKDSDAINNLYGRSGKGRVFDVGDNALRDLQTINRRVEDKPPETLKLYADTKRSSICPSFRHRLALWPHAHPADPRITCATAHPAKFPDLPWKPPLRAPAAAGTHAESV